MAKAGRMPPLSYPTALKLGHLATTQPPNPNPYSPHMLQPLGLRQHAPSHPLQAGTPGQQASRASA